MKEQEYIKFLDQYSQYPPNDNWMKIANRLDNIERDRGAAWFTQSQQYTLFGGILSSIVLCIGLFTYIQPLPQVNNQKIVFSTEKNTIQTTPTIENPKTITSSQKIGQLIPSHNIAQNNLKNKPQLIKNPISYTSPHQGNNTAITNQHTTTKVHGGELIANVPIVESNNEEIKVFINKEWVTLKPLESIAEKKVKETNTKMEVLTTNPINTDILSSFEPTIDKKSEKGYYLTPYFGGNFTQIFYQGSPNSPYFSDNATFTGKIGYNTGVQVGYKLSKHWSIESGIGIGQYIQSFKEIQGNIDRKGVMYIDQIDIPLMARYSLHFGTIDYPKSISFKGGILYNSVYNYQVNYTDINLTTRAENSYQIEADKRLYNSLQLGYLAGIDFDAYLSKRLSLNVSFLNSIVSQLENFPLFNKEVNRPIQVSTTFSMGLKIQL